MDLYIRVPHAPERKIVREVMESYKQKLRDIDAGVAEASEPCVLRM